MTFRYQILSIDGELDGVPYRYIGRALMRIVWLNEMAQQRRYTLKPVRVRGES